MSLYICPVCKEALEISGRSYVCKNRHSFDVAAKGYVNLLGPGKASRGDDAEMVGARRRFLSAGYYEPLRRKICDILSGIEYATLLDAGCGEGYYTKKICEISPDRQIYGLDISKKAAEKAASLCKTANICVASAYGMPYKDGCFDVVLNVFSPLSPDEYRRVLKPGGHLVYAVSNPDHLKELKEAVYDKVFIKEMKDEKISGFDPVGRTDVAFRMELDNAALNDLFMMTPYYRKTSYADKQKLLQTEKLTVTADFAVFEYISRHFC